MSARAPERRIGEIVGGKYRVVRFLAAGGMGVVYEAQHTVVKRRFAVKFLRPDLAEKRESLTRFQREAQTAGALESENVAAAVDFGVASDGSPFIVMEYLVGESLEALLDREGHLPVTRAADLVHQACRGIQAAHAASIVHRDIKPQNLFLCRREDGTDLLKVLDFGIAKLEAVDRNNAATLTGTVLGTPAYMSPEQARGEKSIDHRADVYALGAILYELLSGQKPHPGDSHNAILHHIATQPSVPLEGVWPGLPAALVEAIERALASEPAQRFASAELFGQAIAVWAERKVWPEPERAVSSPAHEASAPTELAPKALERASAATVETGAPHRDAARRAVPRGTIFVGFAAAALVGAWLATRSSNDEAPSPPATPAAAISPPAAKPVVEVNAAEQPLPVNAVVEPTRTRESAPDAAPEPAPLSAPAPASAPSVRSTASDRPRAQVRPTPSSPPVSARPPAGRPETAKSAAPLAFDRQNPYD